MKRVIVVLILCSAALPLLAQYETLPAQPAPVSKRAAITVGFLQGGGSLIGADFEQPPVMLLYSIGIYFPL